MSRYRWHIQPQLNKGGVAWANKLPPLIVQILHNRGITSTLLCDLFFQSDNRLAGDPFLLPDMEKAVIRILRALLSCEDIVIYGDYDCDGITSTAILLIGLSVLGGKVRPYIPHRLLEGYGLRFPVLEKMKSEGVSLVISCDCGISAVTEIRRAKKIGMDVIVTDHHLPLGDLPPAVAVIDPYRADFEYPFLHLSGVGVAYKLMQALFRSLAQPEDLLEKMLDLVALGTVADMVPLLGENRLFVKKGLTLLNQSPRIGVQELLTQARLTGEIDTGRISWMLAPRLNTPGRLEHAMASFKLLVTDSRDEARQISAWLEEKNAERQRITAEALKKAKEQIAREWPVPVIFVADPDFPPGVAGLVAGRLSEEFYRPAFVVHTGEVWSTGSARSIPEYNVVEALQKNRQFLSHFGGHARAAGFTLPTGKINFLKEGLMDLAEVTLAGLDLRPRLDIDATTSLTALGSENIYDYIKQMEPFGEGNPEPVFLSTGVTVIDCHTMGANGEHLRLKVKQNGSVWDAVGFGLGEDINRIGMSLDLVYNLEMDHWNGRDTLRLNVLDFA